MRSHLSSQIISSAPARPRRVVVLGASLAGLLAARVLADHVDHVTVVDRDDLDHELTGPRRGVPQSRHTHGLLVGGADAMESILPGFTKSLIARGALRADVLARSRWLMSGNVLTHDAPGLMGLLASRPLIESEVRRRVTAVPGIELIGGHDIVGVRTDPARTHLTAAVVAPTGSTTAADGPAQAATRDLPADLVVDATGRGSRAPAWLAALGYPTPPETSHDARIHYVTRLFRARPGVLDDIDADIVGTLPATGRGGVALRQEGGRWTVSIAEQFAGKPPTDLDGFRAFARTLPTSGVAEIATHCEPIGDAIPYSYPASRWRHWETLDRRLGGLIVIGDAVCSFNPVYGQGMSSTAQQVTALRTLLADGGFVDLPARTARAFAAVVATPWTLATGSDRRFPGQAPKPLPERLIDRYVDRLLEVATEDGAVAMAFGRVLNLLAPPPTLMSPALTWRVLGPRSRPIVARARAARRRRAEAVTASTMQAAHPQPAPAPVTPAAVS